MTLARRIRLSFAFAFVVLLAAGVASLYGATRLLRTSFWVARSDEVLAELSNALTLVAEAESSARGYALSAGPDQLARHHAARAALPRSLERLGQLTADNPAQQARLSRLDALARERLAISEALTRTRQERGLDAAAAFVATGRGLAAMDRVRDAVAEMDGAERRLLAERTSADRRAARWIYISVGSLSLAGLLLVVAGALLVRRAVTRPLERILAAVDRMAAGDLSAHVDVRTRDELGRLAQALNQMVERRRVAEESLREANTTLDGTFRASPAAIAGINRDGIVDVWNPAAERVFGYSAAEVLGRRLPVIPEDQRADFEALRERVLGRGELVTNLERVRLRKDGTTFLAGVSLAPRRIDGEVRGMLAVAEDITERKRAVEALSRSEAEARRAAQARDDVIGVVAHDLRNPLAAVKLAAEVLDRQLAPTGTSSMRSSVAAIRNAVRRASRLIDDLLDVAQMDAGQLSIEHAPSSLAAIVHDLIEAQRALASSAGVELVGEVPSDLPPVVGDRHRLLQVLENLVGNALKFTPPGGRIRVSAAAKDGAVEVRVADSGTGISAEHLPHLFDRFWQAEPGGPRRGAGLGLSICKSLVEAHGGRIWVESAPGHGTTVSFTLPAAAPTSPSVAPPEPPPPSSPAATTTPSPTPASLRGVRALVVDDDPMTVTALGELLRDEGLEVTTATSGEAALARFAAARPDVVVLDVEMPRMSGVALLERLREQDATLPAVFMTGRGAEDARVARAREALRAAYVAKPVDVDELLRVLAGVVAPRSA